MADGGWRVSIRPSADREIDELDDSVRRDAIAVITDLKDDPFPFGSVLLRGYRDLYRVRFYREQFRIVYSVSVRSRKVVIERVRRRGTAYVGLRALARLVSHQRATARAPSCSRVVRVGCVSRPAEHYLQPGFGSSCYLVR